MHARADMFTHHHHYYYGECDCDPPYSSVAGFSAPSCDQYAPTSFFSHRTPVRFDWWKRNENKNQLSQKQRDAHESIVGMHRRISRKTSTSGRIISTPENMRTVGGTKALVEGMCKGEIHCSYSHPFLPWHHLLYPVKLRVHRQESIVPSRELVRGRDLHTGTISGSVGQLWSF